MTYEVWLVPMFHFFPSPTLSLLSDEIFTSITQCGILPKANIHIQNAAVNVIPVSNSKRFVALS